VLRLPGVPQLQEQLRIAVWQENLERLAKRFHHPRFARKIKKFLLCAS
jgi:hypothetical protein